VSGFSKKVNGVLFPFQNRHYIIFASPKSIEFQSEMKSFCVVFFDKESAIRQHLIIDALNKI